MALYRTRDGRRWPWRTAARTGATRSRPAASSTTRIECGYHGFTFDCSGVVHPDPGAGDHAAADGVRSFPVVEKDGWIWIWTGDPARADVAKVPDTHWMTDPEWATVTHSFPFACRAELIHDNLLDLTHESFIHTSTVGDDYIYKHGITVVVDGDVVSADRLMPGVVAPPLYAAHHGMHGLWDRFHCTEFHAPSFHVLHSGITGQGARARRATSSRS